MADMETNAEADAETNTSNPLKKVLFPLLGEYLADPSLGMGQEKLTEIWDSGVANNAKGRSMLGSLLAQPTFELVDELHLLLKNHMIKSDKSKASAIGQIYLKAWKTSNEERKKVIEEKCIQNLIHCSLWTRMQVAAYCLEALRPFTTQRQLLGIDYMLYDLAEPLIWRSLEAKNNEVRLNAISLLIAMFPMRDKDNQPIAGKELLDRQIKAFHEYMVDDIEEIRVKAITGICQMLSLYWEIIPRSDSRKFLSLLVNDLAWDGSSVTVRVAVIRGLSAVLQNELSHLSLEALLPKLEMNIHDRAESVRLAMVDLLLDTRSLKILKFWKVVGIDHILRRLAAENSAQICERIVQLLVESYFNTKVDDDERIGRAVALFQANTVAPRKFYQYAAKLVPVELVVDRILLFIRYVYGCAKSSRIDASANSSGTDSSGDESPTESAHEKTMDSVRASSYTAADIPIFVSFLDCAAILWTSIGPELKKEEHRALVKLLHKQGGGMIVRCASHFEDQPTIVDSLLVLIGLMAKASARYVSSSLNRKFKAIEDGGFDSKLHGSLVEAVGFLQLDDVVNLVLKWWQSFSSPFLTSASSTPPPSKSKRVRISVPEIADSSNPRLGIQVIAYLLNRDGTRKYILNSHIEKVRELETELEELWEHCLALPEKSTFDARWTAEILKLRATMVCLLCSKEGGSVEATNFLAPFMDLLRINILPVFKALTSDVTSGNTNESSTDSEREVNDDKLERAKAIIQTSFTIWSDFIMCGFCDDTTVVMATDLTKEMIQNESGSAFHVETAQLIYHVLDHIRHHGLGAETAMLLQPWFDQIMTFSTNNRDLFDGMEEVNQLVEKFSEVLGNGTD